MYDITTCIAWCCNLFRVMLRFVCMSQPVSGTYNDLAPAPGAIQQEATAHGFHESFCLGQCPNSHSFALNHWTVGTIGIHFRYQVSCNMASNIYVTSMHKFTGWRPFPVQGHGWVAHKPWNLHGSVFIRSYQPILSLRRVIRNLLYSQLHDTYVWIWTCI